MTDTETTVEVWRYAGARVTTKGQRRAAWWTPHNAGLLLFEDSATYAIAGHYDVNVKREDNGNVVMIGTPKFRGRRADDDPDALLWEASHSAAMAELARRRAQANAVKEQAMQAALEPLRRIARGLRTGAERDAFAARIIREITGPWTVPGGGQ